MSLFSLPYVNSGGTFRNVPPLLSHVRLYTARGYAYVLAPHCLPLADNFDTSLREKYILPRTRRGKDTAAWGHAALRRDNASKWRCRGRPPDVPSVINKARAVGDAGPYGDMGCAEPLALVVANNSCSLSLPFVGQLPCGGQKRATGTFLSRTPLRDCGRSRAPPLRGKGYSQMPSFSRALIFSAVQKMAMACSSSLTGGRVGAMRILLSLGSMP